MIVALTARMVFPRAARIVEECAEDDLLRTDKEGGDAEPEVVVRDFAVTVEVAAGVEEGEDEGLDDAGEDDEFEVDEFAKGSVAGHGSLEASVEAQDGEDGHGDEDGPEGGDPDVSEMDVVGCVAECPGGLGGFLGDEEDGPDHGVEEDDDPGSLEPLEAAAESDLAFGADVFGGGEEPLVLAVVGGDIVDNE